MPGGSLIGESLQPHLLHRAAAIPPSATTANIATKRCLLALAQACYLTAAVVVAHEVYARSSRAIDRWFSSFIPTSACGARSPRSGTVDRRTGKPASYGLSEPFPDGFFAQQAHAFRQLRHESAAGDLTDHRERPDRRARRIRRPRP